MISMVSVVIPTFNGGSKIGSTLESLTAQDYNGSYEIIVVDDGSTDNTVEVAKSFGEKVSVFSQTNQGPAAARNNGARRATGEIILFTDDDCVPQKNWISKMVEPFSRDPEVVGVKGVYRTNQKEFTARFVQIEYEDKYDVMAEKKYIDFIDTYSAGFRKENFLKFEGYDISFPVACAEDVELSYRMYAENIRMIFLPEAVVAHTHPNSPVDYFKKKYKFAFWRMLALKKNPQKIISDSHTPQVMKLQLLIAPFILLFLTLGFFETLFFELASIFFITFVCISMPFVVKGIKRDFIVGLLSPFFLIIRSFAQFLGVFKGSIFALRFKDQTLSPDEV